MPSFREICEAVWNTQKLKKQPPAQIANGDRELILRLKYEMGNISLYPQKLPEQLALSKPLETLVELLKQYGVFPSSVRNLVIYRLLLHSNIIIFGAQITKL